MARCGGVSVGAPPHRRFVCRMLWAAPSSGFEAALSRAWVACCQYAYAGLALCGVLPVIIRAAFAARCALAVGFTPRFPFCYRRGGGGAALRCRCGLARRATMRKTADRDASCRQHDGEGDVHALRVAGLWKPEGVQQAIEPAFRLLGRVLRPGFVDRRRLLVGGVVRRIIRCIVRRCVRILELGADRDVVDQGPRVRDENAPIRNATVVLKIITSWHKGTGREGWERSVFSRCGMLRLRAARTMAGGAYRASRQARGNSGGGCAFDGLSSHVVSAGSATNGAQGSAEAPACNPTSLMPARRNRNRVSLPTDILNGTEHMEGAP